MKSGVIVIISLVILLAVVGGYFYFNSLNNDGNGVVCTADAKQCPDGSYVSRNPNNNCEFFACPETNQTNNQTNETGEGNDVIYPVMISGFAFAPATLEINVGDTVSWINEDSASHTVTSDSGGELNSQYLSKNEQYTHTFTTAGTFDYHCTPHPYMKGKVIVN